MIVRSPPEAARWLMSCRIAGSETTATALACITYYLLKTPGVLCTLRTEIRTSFDSYDQINDASTAKLEYLSSVIREGMRMYPPLPFALPRVVPKGGAVVDGHFIPQGVSATDTFAPSNHVRSLVIPVRKAG